MSTSVNQVEAEGPRRCGRSATPQRDATRSTTKTTRRKLSVEKKFVSLWTRRQKSKLCHCQSCVAWVGFRRQSRVAVRHTAVQNSCLAVVTRFQSCFLHTLSASVMCSAQAAGHVHSGMSPEIWTWLCMVTTSSSLDVVRTSKAGQCRHRLSDQGVASPLLQELCRTCISSVASIVWCLIGVVVSCTSWSPRQRVGTLVWRQVPRVVVVSLSKISLQPC